MIEVKPDSFFSTRFPKAFQRAHDARSFLSLQQAFLSKGFEDLACLSSIPVVPKPWQKEAAIKVLRDMHGSAILADEVGLGKTVEAGLILKELLHRKLVKRVLILVPAPLVEQWTREMEEKFHLSFADYRNPGWESSPLVLSSLPYAARNKTRRTELQDHGFDLLIVDEAHSLKNQKTQSYQFVYKIKRRYTLLMSATPIQNDLKELFNLVNLLKPGYLKNRRSFFRTYVKDRFTPKNAATLRSLLGEVMIRNRRTNTLVELPRRNTHAITVSADPAEQRFYDGVLTFARRVYEEKASHSPMEVLPLIGLLKQNSSSPSATLRYLEKNYHGVPEVLRLIEEGQTLHTPSKAKQIVHSLKDGRQALVYTEFLGTLDMLSSVMHASGISHLSFHGGLSAKQKTDAIRRFRDGEVQVLLSTESGSQGLNLQTCSRLYNYDLPWNPMRIEQRIGRIHRFGQQNEVDVYSLVTKGSFDEYILYILTHKIKLFERVVGELDTIMSYLLDEESSLDVRIGRLILDCKDPEELRSHLEEIGKRFTTAQTAYEKHRRQTENIWKELEQ